MGADPPSPGSIEVLIQDEGLEMSKCSMLVRVGVVTVSALMVLTAAPQLAESVPKKKGKAARPKKRTAPKRKAKPAARKKARPAARKKARPARPRPARPRPARPAAKCTQAAVKRIAGLNVKALSDYDGFDFESAKQSLQDAIAHARRSRCVTHVVGAKSYLYLGVVQVGGFRDFAAGKKAWYQVFRIFPDMKIPRRLATPRLLRAYIAAKQAFKAGGGRRVRVGTRVVPTARRVPTGPAKGLEHEPISEATATKKLTISCRVGDEMAATKIGLFYRPSYAAAYRKVDMAKKGKWAWNAVIPGPKVRGTNLRYYLVVWGAGGKAVAASGNAASPHMITLKRPKTAAGGAEENPLSGRRTRRTSRGRARVSYGEVEIPGMKRKRRKGSSGDTPPGVKLRTAPGRSKHRPYFAIYAGTGIGIGLLNGVTEVARSADDFDQPEPVPDDISRGAIYGHIDLAFLLNRTHSLGILARIGKTSISRLVEDQRKKNNMDWQVFLRYRYMSKMYGFGAKTPAWLGWKWFAGGGVGYGEIRHHILAKNVQVEEGVRDNYTDTDLAKGVLPNVFGGAMLCFWDARLNVFLEINYMAAFSDEPRDNLYFHMDFTFGLSTEF